MLRDLAKFPPLVFHPRNSGQCTQLDMLIHDGSQASHPALSSFGRGKLDEILFDEGWFRFAAIRHPFDRVFSAWRDKIFLCEPSFEAYASNDGRKYVDFSEFVDRITQTENPSACDIHWRSQVALLRPDDIPFTKIYDVSEVAQLPADLQQHLDRLGLADKVLPLRRVNESFPIKPEGFFSRDIADKLRDFHREDFERFEFRDWDVPDEASRSAADLVSYATDAIFDRNRVIAACYNYALWRPRSMSDRFLTAVFGRLGFIPPERRGR